MHNPAKRKAMMQAERDEQVAAANKRIAEANIVGIVGIVLLLFLIPMCIGLKDSSKEKRYRII